jgi:hypothetical protein
VNPNLFVKMAFMNVIKDLERSRATWMVSVLQEESRGGSIAEDKEMQ